MKDGRCTMGEGGWEQDGSSMGEKEGIKEKRGVYDSDGEYVR